jgi:hypothetical protein
MSANVRFDTIKLVAYVLRLALLIIAFGTAKVGSTAFAHGSSFLYLNDLTSL